MELSNITPEQAEQLKEKLESMSPEELKEFQKKQCIFCHIVSGKTSSKKIYEDDKALAILDINPASVGHILLLPKEHYTILPQIPDEEVEHLFMVTKALSHSALRALQCQGTTIFIANGVAAGQKAQHFMLHIIPRFNKDNIGIDLPENKFEKTDIETVQKRLMKKIEETLGGKEKEKEKKPEEKETKKEKKKKEPEKITPKVMEAEFEEVKPSNESEKGLETREKQSFSVNKETSKKFPVSQKSQSDFLGSQKSPISEKSETFQKEKPIKKEPIKKKKKALKKKRKKKEVKPKKEKIDLDDIAKVLGVK